MTIFDNLEIEKYLCSQEDSISLLIFLSNLTPILPGHVEKASYIIFSITNSLAPSDFNQQFPIWMNTLQNNNCIHLKSFDVNFAYNKFEIQILFLTSIRYRKSLFQSINCDTFLLHYIIMLSGEIFQVDNPLSLQILKIVELILLKRKDLPLSQLGLPIFKMTSKAFISPHAGFRECAQNINKIIFKEPPQILQHVLCNINNWPLKEIDTSEALQLKGHLKNSEKAIISDLVVNLFNFNTLNRDAALCYNIMVTNTNFDDFCDIIWPHFKTSLIAPEEKGEFYQSYVKYWTPASVKQYQAKFYEFIKHKNVCFKLKAQTLFEIRKQGAYEPHFNNDLRMYIEYSPTSQLGLKTLSTYTKKSHQITQFDLDMMTKWIKNYKGNECDPDLTKSCQRFISHLFFMAHIDQNKNESNFRAFSDFLHFISSFCLNKLQSNAFEELPFVLLRILWDIATGSSEVLTTLYKIDRENVYQSGCNLLFKKLEVTGFWAAHFQNEAIVTAINAFPIHKWICPALAQLISLRYISTIKLNKSVSQHIEHPIFAGHSTNLKLLTLVHIAYYKHTGIDYHCEIGSLCKIYLGNLGRVQEKELFLCVCVLDILLTIKEWEEIDLTELTERSLDFLNNFIEWELNNTGLSVKVIKILEAFINNILDCLMKSTITWCTLDKTHILKCLSTIIQKTNMKKPVTKAVHVLQVVSLSMENDDGDRITKLKLLDDTLHSLQDDVSRIHTKIRKNPETRLVIHALCISDSSKSFICWSMNFMLNLLSDIKSSNETLSSTLNSIELLISDCVFHRTTLKYIPTLLIHCIALNNRDSWIVKNANLQVIKVIVERFYGVSLGTRLRPKSVENLLSIFPNLTSIFEEHLTSDILIGSPLIVLILLSEAQIKNTVFNDDPIRTKVCGFRSRCLDIIKYNSANNGFFAVNACAALCCEYEILPLFRQLSNYIIKHFAKMKTNVFANLIHLLKELSNKAVGEYSSIGDEWKCLIAYLKLRYVPYFDLINLKVYSCIEAIYIIDNAGFDNLDCWTKRLWFYNYIPHLAKNANLSFLSCLLEKVSFANFPEYLQEKLLSVVLDRLTQEESHVKDIVNLRNFFIRLLTSLGESNNYLLLMYGKTVFLLNTLCDNCNSYSDGLIEKVSTDILTNSLHKKLAYASVISNIGAEYFDKAFLRSFFKLSEIRLLEDEYLPDVATNLINLHKCCVDHEDILSTLKLAFYLSLTISSSLYICPFITYLTSTVTPSVAFALEKLLDLQFLMFAIGEGKSSVGKYLTDIRSFIEKLIANVDMQSETFYEIETDFWISLDLVADMVDAAIFNCTSL